MPDWLNLQQAGRVSEVGEGFDIANGGGTQLIASASTNTKGAWAVLSAVTPFEAHGICLSFSRKSSGVDQLIDIGFGTVGNEHVLVPNVYYAGGSSSSYNKCIWIPVNVPAGVRLVARTQSQTASVNSRCSVCLFQSGWLGVPSLGKIVAMGDNTAATGGVALGAPAGNDTWGAWTEISASGPSGLKWIMPIFGDAGISTRTSGQRFFGQLGIGGAGDEQAIGPEFPWSSSSTSFSANMWHGFWCDLPASERLVARYGSSATTTLGCHCIVYGGW